MAGYNIQVKDKTDRMVRIAHELASPLRKTPQIIRDVEHECAVIRISIDTLIYRMRNWRTDLEQMEYARAHDLPEDYFASSDEDLEAQRIQHSILLKMSKDSDVNIYSVLEQENKQTELLIITAAGVMVNGNRRLAAMRDMYCRDSSRFAGFSHANVMVLPGNTTETDIELLETDLQLAPDMRQEYNWVSRRRKIWHQLNAMHIPREDIRRHFRFSKDEDLNRELAELDLVNEDLEQYLDQPKRYLEVGDSMQMFEDLQKALEGRSPSEQQTAKAIAWPLIHQSRRLGGRVYDFKFAFGKKSMHDVAALIAADEGIAISGNGDCGSGDSGDDSVGDEDPLASLGGMVQDHYVPFRAWLSDAQNSSDVAQKIVAACTSIKAGVKESQKKHAALNSAKAANTSLNSIDLLQSDVGDIKAVIAQLENAIETAGRKLLQAKSLLQ